MMIQFLLENTGFPDGRIYGQPFPLLKVLKKSENSSNVGTLRGR